MIANYQTNVKAVIAFVKQLKVKVNNNTINETLQNHPDWPSLLCVSDSLHKWGIANGAGKIEPSMIDELPTPFIAYTSNLENPLAIVTSVANNTIEKRQTNYGKTVLQNKTDFINSWAGVYLIAEPDEHSGEQNYKLNKRKEFLNSVIPAAAIAVLLIISLNQINKIAIGSFSVTGIYLQYLVLIAGVFVTSLLLWYEVDKNNPVLQKVCTGIAKGNCNAILTGKQAKVFNWLSWSEVGFFYFIGNMITFLALDKSIYLLAWFGLLAMPYTIFSVYYQWRIAKQWCVLCLAVQALLLVGGINSIANNFLFPVSHFSYLYIFRYLFLFAITPLFWFTLKPYILRLQEVKNTKREYLRIKFNAEIFETLLKKQKSISLSAADGLGIDIGNPAAGNTIIKVCNPYCSPCAAAHTKIEEIIKSNSNVKAKIIFATPNDKTNIGFKPVQHLLAIAATGNNEITHMALDDWYLPSKKDYEIFSTKHKMNGELEQQNIKIEMMEKWCKETVIIFTPTIFINGYQLPDVYNIEEVAYFLQE